MTESKTFSVPLTAGHFFICHISPRCAALLSNIHLSVLNISECSECIVLHGNRSPKLTTILVKDRLEDLSETSARVNKGQSDEDSGCVRNKWKQKYDAQSYENTWQD